MGEASNLESTIDVAELPPRADSLRRFLCLRFIGRAACMAGRVDLSRMSKGGTRARSPQRSSSTICRIRARSALVMRRICCLPSGAGRLHLGGTQNTVSTAPSKRRWHRPLSRTRQGDPASRAASGLLPAQLKRRHAATHLVVTDTCSAPAPQLAQTADSFFQAKHGDSVSPSGGPRRCHHAFAKAPMVALGPGPCEDGSHHEQTTPAPQLAQTGSLNF